MKFSKRYWAVWQRSGDSGVMDRGTFLLQTNDRKKIEELYEYCADHCDDRELCRVISTNI
jgi:hypothetical protein